MLMTFDELVAKYQQQQPRRYKDEEHRLQVACVRWFRMQYSGYGNLLFAVPNGGLRNKSTAARLKAEGVVAGVADLVLLLPNQQYHAMCIELKTPKGRQQDTQKQWQQSVVRYGYCYVICHSLDEFVKDIKEYIQNRK